MLTCLLLLWKTWQATAAAEFFVNIVIFFLFSLAVEWHRDVGMWYVLICVCGVQSQLLFFLLYSRGFRRQPNKSIFRSVWFMKFSLLLTVCPFLSLQAKTWASPTEPHWCWTGEFWFCSLPEIHFFFPQCYFYSVLDRLCPAECVVSNIWLALFLQFSRTQTTSSRLASFFPEHPVHDCIFMSSSALS